MYVTFVLFFFAAPLGTGAVKPCKATASSRPGCWCCHCCASCLVSAPPPCAAAVPVAPSLLFPVVVASIPPVVAASRLLSLCPLTLTPLGSLRARPVWFAHLLLVCCLYCLMLSWSSALDFFFFRFVSFGVANCSHRSIDVPPLRPRFAVLLLPSGCCCRCFFVSRVWCRVSATAWPLTLAGSPRAALRARCPSGPNANIMNYITLRVSAIVGVDVGGVGCEVGCWHLRVPRARAASAFPVPEAPATAGSSSPVCGGALAPPLAGAFPPPAPVTPWGGLLHADHRRLLCCSIPLPCTSSLVPVRSSLVVLGLWLLYVVAFFLVPFVYHRYALGV
jgi:hypothetical protein